MSSNNYDTSLDNKKFSDYEITKYELEYGVKIRKKDNKTHFKGSDKNVEKVKGIVKRQMFLQNNPLSKQKIKPSSILNDLDDVEYKPDYSKMYSKNSNKNLYKVQEFRFY
tara:strand:+ start:263 stop:592 length:330 start_codon:yes stop_codon:yes gene_type:complete